MVCSLARAGKVLVSGQIGTMPEEPDVTKTSERRLQELTEKLQPRAGQPVAVIHNLPEWGGVLDVDNISLDPKE